MIDLQFSQVCGRMLVQYVAGTAVTKPLTLFLRPPTLLPQPTMRATSSVAIRPYLISVLFPVSPSVSLEILRSLRQQNQINLSVRSGSQVSKSAEDERTLKLFRSRNCTFIGPAKF